MSSWTLAQVEALSPDSASLKASAKLTAAKWSNLGQVETALWGECQGSGKTPYLTRIDLTGPAFKCSCPSRKFPCKHALALFKLWVQDSPRFKASSPPAWLTEWLDSRASRKENTEKKATALVDEVAQAKRVAAREEKVEAGLAELELWLHDLLRTGLMGLSSKPGRYLDDMAARLVDAQAPGLARLLKDLPALMMSGTDWTQDVLACLGNLQLIISAYRRQEDLPETVRADLRRVLGWNDNQKELQGNEGLADSWLVLAQLSSQEDRLQVRRSWLWGKETGKVALILEFSFAGQTFQYPLVVGQKFEMELVYFPSQYPLRAVPKELQMGGKIGFEEKRGLRLHPHFDACLAAYAEALAANCWLEQFPLAITKVAPLMHDGRLVLVDEQNKTLPLSPVFTEGWRLMALSGGEPCDLVAEWDGKTLLPLAIWQEQPVSLRGT